MPTGVTAGVIFPVPTYRYIIDALEITIKPHQALDTELQPISFVIQLDTDLDSEADRIFNYQASAKGWPVGPCSNDEALEELSMLAPTIGRSFADKDRIGITALTVALPKAILEDERDNIGIRVINQFGTNNPSDSVPNGGLVQISLASPLFTPDLDEPDKPLSLVPGEPFELSGHAWSPDSCSGEVAISWKRAVV